MNRCELCKRKARVKCEADQANLCWGCDTIVHSANFLVARHSRSLLCKLCKSPLSWSSSGTKLTPIVSVCEQCSSPGKREAKQEVVVYQNQEDPWSPPSDSDSR